MRVAASLFLTVTLALPGCEVDTYPEFLPDRLVVVSGNHQSAKVTETVPDPLRVRVVQTSGDGFGVQGMVPVGGVVVCYASDDDDAGEPSQECTQTEADGGGEVLWTMGAKAGVYEIYAYFSNDDVQVRSEPFVLEALAGEAARVGFESAEAGLEPGKTLILDLPAAGHLNPVSTPEAHQAGPGYGSSRW